MARTYNLATGLGSVDGALLVNGWGANVKTGLIAPPQNGCSRFSLAAHAMQADVRGRQLRLIDQRRTACCRNESRLLEKREGLFHPCRTMYRRASGSV